MDNKKRVLVAEDEDDARMIFVDYLRDNGFESEGAVDGVDALKKLQDAYLNKAAFDLLLLDIIMPNKDGLQTLEEIKSHKETYGNPSVVMLTNISGEMATEQALKSQADGFLTKSTTDPQKLIGEIKKYLHVD